MNPLAAAVLLAFVPGGACAGGVGTTGANLLKVEVGARSLAMGGAGTGMPGDLSGLVVNPSLLSPVAARSLMLMHWPGLGGGRTEFASYSVPAGGLGIFAATVLFRTLPDIDNEEAVDPVVPVSDGMIMVTLARRVGKSGGHGGVNLKLFNSTLGTSRATSVAIDLGMLAQTRGAAPLRYGLSVTNLGNPIKHEEAGEPLPMAVHGGASWSKLWYPNGLELAADAMFNVEQNARVAAGAEWVQAGRLGLRAGGTLSRYGGARYTMGAGWKFRSTFLGPEAEYHLDYAYLPFQMLGTPEPTHAVSLFVKF